MDDDKDEEKEKHNAVEAPNNVTPLRVVLGGGGRPNPMNAQLVAHQQKNDIINCLNRYLQMALNGGIEMMAIVVQLKVQEPELTAARVETQPSNYDRFRMLGMLQAALHFELQKLTTDAHPQQPVPPKGA